MKAAELRGIVSRPSLDRTAQVHVVTCGAAPCRVAGVAQGGGELHLFCEHEAHRYPAETVLHSYVEEAAQAIAAAGHLPLGDARAVVEQAVEQFGLSVEEPINWDVAPMTHSQEG